MEELCGEVFAWGFEVLADEGEDVGFGEVFLDADGHADAADELLELVGAGSEACVEACGGDEGEGAAGLVVEVAEEFEVGWVDGACVAGHEAVGFVYDEDAVLVEAAMEGFGELDDGVVFIGSDAVGDGSHEGFDAADGWGGDEDGASVVVGGGPCACGDGFAGAGFADDGGDGVVGEGVVEAGPDEA